MELPQLLWTVMTDEFPVHEFLVDGRIRAWIDHYLSVTRLHRGPMSGHAPASDVFSDTFSSVCFAVIRLSYFETEAI